MAPPAGRRRRTDAVDARRREDRQTARDLRGGTDLELIHTCYRITDIDRSVAFYEALGFEERGRLPIRDGAINVFMGLPGDGSRVELAYNFGRYSYELCPGYQPIRGTDGGPARKPPQRSQQGSAPRKA